MEGFGRGREHVEKLFESGETEELSDFKTSGRYKDPYEVEPTHYEFTADDSHFKGPTAWLRGRNRTSYNYDTGYLLLRRKTEKKVDRDGDHESVALLNLEPGLRFFEDSEALADLIVKVASGLTARYKQQSAGGKVQERTGPRASGHVTVVDQTHWTSKGGKKHTSQYVLILSVWGWSSGDKPSKEGKRLSPSDVTASFKLRSTLYGGEIPDKSHHKEGDMAYDGYGYTTCVGHLVGLLRSDNFKKCVQEAIRHVESCKKPDSSEAEDKAAGSKRKRSKEKRSSNSKQQQQIETVEADEEEGEDEESAQTE